jgi:NAD(P)-dependent dehydrogenase (short-subunit alcohol dehydrogenase family)
MTKPDSALIGRKAVVLGANDPAAAAIALALAHAGADVAVTSTSGDPEEAFALRPLRRAIEAAGRQSIADVADLGNGSSVQIAVRQIAKQLGRIDLLVIVSSEAAGKPVQRMTDAEWSRAIGYNLGAYFYACRAVAKEFGDNEAVGGVKGRIIALLPAVEETPGGAVLHAARAGVEALVRALAAEWAREGIVVTAVMLAPETDESLAVEAALRLAVGGIEVTGAIVALGELP